MTTTTMTRAPIDVSALAGVVAAPAATATAPAAITTTTPKAVLRVTRAPGRHWVGDGFAVHSMFGYSGAGVAERSPFLLLDYAAPMRFEPSAGGHRRGVGQHPHRGFETVTIVYDGEVQHRDSSGAGGVIGRGDVQWMTAGGGILHEEFHSDAYSRTGGPFEMVQLWVNLPARDKRAPGHYQGITDGQIPVVALPDGGGRVRVIAGDFAGTRGPAATYTPMNVWDVRLAAGARVALDQPEGWSTLVLVLDGTVQINGDAVLRPAELATLSHAGSGLAIEANSDAKLLVLGGEPIDEPVVGYGPFVMTSAQEIAEAVADFNAGGFGRKG